MSLTIEPATPTQSRPIEPDELPPGHSTGQPSLAALSTRRLCPYLEIEGGAWRSAKPDRDHRCGAVTPVALLSLEKQRRLCLTERHIACATYLAARGVDETGHEGEPALVAVGPGRPLGPEGVTRWAIVRTTPVVLDHSRVPAVGAIVRNRALGQAGLAIVLVAALAAIAIPRLSGGSSQALVGTLPSSSSAAAVPSTRSAPPSPVSAAPETPAPTPAQNTAGPSPSPTASPSPITAATYRVHQGDTLYGIAVRFHTSVGAIRRLNHLSGNTLHIGQVLKVPQTSS